MSVALLEPEIAKAFPTSKAVNEALHGLLSIAEQASCIIEHFERMPRKARQCCAVILFSRAVNLNRFNRIEKIFFALLLIAAISGCKGTASYKPPYLPVSLAIDMDGNVSIQGTASILTFLGEFSVGAEYTLKSNNNLIVIIRNSQKRTGGIDSIYRLEEENDIFTAVVNGKAMIEAEKGRFLINVIDGEVQNVTFKRKAVVESETKSVSLIQAYFGYETDFWDQALFGYYPFALTIAVYDDSAIEKWYGFGFLFFISRLFAAFFCLFIDIILIFFFGISEILHLSFGVTVRNVFVGLCGIIFMAVKTRQCSNYI